MQFTILVENLHGKYPRTAPPLLKVGLLQWNQFDSIVRQGEQHAREVLDQAEGGVAAPAA